jgi:hypothetical protein
MQMFSCLVSGAAKICLRFLHSIIALSMFCYKISYFNRCCYYYKENITVSLDKTNWPRNIKYNYQFLWVYNNLVHLPGMQGSTWFDSHTYCSAQSQGTSPHLPFLKQIIHKKLQHIWKSHLNSKATQFSDVNWAGFPGNQSE